MEVIRRRRRIDAADRELVRLLNKRMRLSIEIGHLKRERGIPLFDRKRERDILRRVHTVNGGPLDSRALRGFYAWLLGESRRITRRELRSRGASGRKGTR